MQTTKKIIKRERVELYKDFTINLVNYIIDYYLDPKTLSDDVDIKNHFNWSYNKVCDEFKKEGFDFSTNKELKEYFFNFYYHQFYKREDNDKTDLLLKYFDKFWRNIFDCDNIKSNGIISSLIEVYNIYDKSL